MKESLIDSAAFSSLTISSILYDYNSVKWRNCIIHKQTCNNGLFFDVVNDYDCQFIQHDYWRKLHISSNCIVGDSLDFINYPNLTEIIIDNDVFNAVKHLTISSLFLRMVLFRSS